MAITNVEALQGLYVALGGELSTVANLTTIPEMLDAIASIASSGAGTALPTVTSEDNGKLLTVVEGEWNKADPTNPLPTVTSDDNGKVLGVNEGEWNTIAVPIDTVVIQGTFNLGNYSFTMNDYTLKDVNDLLTSGKLVVLIAQTPITGFISFYPTLADVQGNINFNNVRAGQSNGVNTAIIITLSGSDSGTGKVFSGTSTVIKSAT